MTREVLVSCDGPDCGRQWQEDNHGAPVLGEAPPERIAASFDGRRSLDFCSHACLSAWRARDLEQRTALSNRWNRLQRCGNPYCQAALRQGGDPAWRWTGTYWEHHCPPHAQAEAIGGKAPVYSTVEAQVDQTPTYWWAAEPIVRGTAAAHVAPAATFRPAGAFPPSPAEQRAWLERQQERLDQL